MKRVNNKPQDKKSFRCPQCEKQRLIRPLGHTVSLEKQTYKARNDSEVELFVDICDSCRRRNYRIHFEPSKADVRKILQAMQGETKLEEDESLEDLL